MTEGLTVGRVRPCRLVKLPEFTDARGSLAAIEIGETVGFPVERVYYLYDTPAGTVRGVHAHRHLEQLIIAMHGSFDVMVNDGYQESTFRLDHQAHGLYVGPMIWRSLVNFSEGAVCLVLASAHYDEADYYREYGEFLRDARGVS